MTLDDLIAQGHIVLTRPDWPPHQLIQINGNTITFYITTNLAEEENIPLKELAQTGWIPLCPGHKGSETTMSGT